MRRTRRKPAIAAVAHRPAGDYHGSMDAETIQTNVRRILDALPEHVTLVAAGKMRTPEEQLAAAAAGVSVIGHNYVQQAEAARAAVGDRVRWHLIGHLQRNKAKKAVELFDMVESLDSERLARALDKAAAKAGRVLPVLIEVNSGEEHSKAGVMPDAVEGLARQLAAVEHLDLQGLMTMGPYDPDAERMRPYFRKTRELFDALAAAAIPGVQMRWLSMGMSDSYRVAIEEGANLVRIGSALFGPR